MDRSDTIVGWCLEGSNGSPLECAERLQGHGSSLLGGSDGQLERRKEARPFGPAWKWGTRQSVTLTVTGSHDVLVSGGKGFYCIEIEGERGRRGRTI
jgi:hypothetical protein